eukprot:scaffold2362_cov109-Cylindrotheca_fusiformis.AAC.2
MENKGRCLLGHVTHDAATREGHPKQTMTSRFVIGFDKRSFLMLSCQWNFYQPPLSSTLFQKRVLHSHVHIANNLSIFPTQWTIPFTRMMTHPSTTNNYFFFDASWPYPGKRNNEALDDKSVWRTDGPSEDYSSHFQGHTMEPVRKRARLISDEDTADMEMEGSNDPPVLEEMNMEPSDHQSDKIVRHNNGKSLCNNDIQADKDEPTEVDNAERNLFNRLILQRISSRYHDPPVMDYVDAKLQELIRGSLRQAMHMHKRNGVPSLMRSFDNPTDQIPDSSSSSSSDCETNDSGATVAKYINDNDDDVLMEY